MITTATADPQGNGEDEMRQDTQHPSRVSWPGERAPETLRISATAVIQEGPDTQGLETAESASAS